MLPHLEQYQSDEAGSVRFCRTLDAMSRYGGHFVQALAAAWRRADADNHRRLLAAFPEYYAHYADLAQADAARESAGRAVPHA